MLETAADQTACVPSQECQPLPTHHEVVFLSLIDNFHFFYFSTQEQTQAHAHARPVLRHCATLQLSPFHPFIFFRTGDRTRAFALSRSPSSSFFSVF